VQCHNVVNGFDAQIASPDAIRRIQRVSAPMVTSHTLLTTAIASLHWNRSGRFYIAKQYLHPARSGQLDHCGASSRNYQ
jgi:hypothetical protein